jgi:hypothetical protein
MDGPDGSPFPIRAKLPARLCHRLRIAGVDAAYAVGNLSIISLLVVPDV